MKALQKVSKYDYKFVSNLQVLIAPLFKKQLVCFLAAYLLCCSSTIDISKQTQSQHYNPHNKFTNIETFFLEV